MLAEAYEAICDEAEHPAMGAFDTAALIDELRSSLRAGLSDDEYVGVVVSGTERGSDAVLVCSGFPEAQQVRDLVLPLALARELLVYDPQRQVVWGNKRPRSG